MHDLEIPAQNSIHTMKRLIAPLTWLKKSATFFPGTPFNKDWYFEYENNVKLQRTTTQIVRNEILFMFNFE